MINQDRILLAELAALLIRGKDLLPEQEMQLKVLLARYPETRQILTEMIEDGQVVLDFNPDKVDMDAVWSSFQSKKHIEDVPVRRVFPWKSVLRIAAVSTLISIGTYLWWNRTQKPDYIIHKAQYGQQNDIMPGSNFAQLEVLGKGIFDLKNGDTQITELGKTSYNAKLKDGHAGKGEIHRLKTPVRSYYSMVLTDGTKVWLNAESQLEYIAGFTNAERRVKLTGEAYFEVAKDAKRPFIVETNEMEIQAVGTAFSVQSYTEEPKVILTEGIVALRSAGKQLEMTAGHKAAFSDGQISIRKSDGNEDALAIKEGYFNFNDKNLQEILDEIHRWYGVDIVLKRPLGIKKYIGGMERDVTLAEVCKLLKKLTNYTFTIEEDKLIIQ